MIAVVVVVGGVVVVVDIDVVVVVVVNVVVVNVVEWAHVPGPEMKLFMSSTLLRFSLSPLAKYAPGISEHSGDIL